MLSDGCDIRIALTICYVACFLVFMCRLLCTRIGVHIVVSSYACRSCRDYLLGL